MNDVLMRPDGDGENDREKPNTTRRASDADFCFCSVRTFFQTSTNDAARSVLTEGDCDRIWDAVENGVRTLAEMEDDE